MTVKTMFRTTAARIKQDERGATLVEFGIVAPVMCLLLVGAFDFAHTLYARAVLQGAVQKAARDSALETGAEETRQDTLDQKVITQARSLARNATVTISRRYYRSFSDAAAAKAETWTDTNLNGKCDAGEPYQDANLNSTWDRDGGDSGQGGAKDAVLYTATMVYPRMLPLKGFIPGINNTITLTASTVLKNQPYGDQQSYAEPVVRNCP
jgi:Flp pilus assembly protein TadG